jgi:hypothetical protein
MLILVQIDLAGADVAAFEHYENGVLALLPGHGARLIERLRSVDGHSETHLLQFPHPGALEAFRADPVRAELQELWLRSGASSTLTEVTRLA